MQNIIRRFRRFITNSRIPNRTKKLGTRTTTFAKKRPIATFFTALALLFALIVLGSFLNKPTPEKEAKKEAKAVTTYSIGEAPRVSFQAKIEKSGIVTISALTPGVVSYVNVVEGQQVGQYTNLVGISSNYSGGNVASLGRELAFLQYNNATATAELQRDTIKKQREIAEKTDENADRLREITTQSLSETRNLVSLNESALANVNASLQTTPPSEPAYAQLIASRLQLEGGLAQLRAGLRNAEYQENPASPAASLSNLGKDVALRQLDLQEKAINLGIESASLSLKIAQVNEASFYPSAPFAGIVERVHVVPGEVVNPGTPLLTLHGDQTLKAVVLVPAEIARKVSKVENSEIVINGKRISMPPSHVSNEATDGQLYSVIYQLPTEYQNDATNNSFITVDVPVGLPDTGSVASYIPIDTVYQTQNNAYIYVLEGNKVKSRNVTLGAIFGEFVEVERGLESGDQIIVNRTVIAGDTVKTQ
jgi:RND family efflux transporter MFP subunit